MTECINDGLGFKLCDNSYGEEEIVFETDVPTQQQTYIHPSNYVYYPALPNYHYYIPYTHKSSFNSFIMPCNPEKSRLCGKTCVGLNRKCKKTPDPAGHRKLVEKMKADAAKRRKEGALPNCTEGRSKLCGRACIGINRTCKKNPTERQLQREWTEFLRKNDRANLTHARPDAVYSAAI